jgi:hypothetical protein
MGATNNGGIYGGTKGAALVKVTVSRKIDTHGEPNSVTRQTDINGKLY